ncbi:hypothetical protein F5Y17DRAFT_424155 [Xylariaceae sp. FL0594]|nr:hypothetical protein F5Y17DRAFT_424155 [Xylariaceae sp. FL0594]
MPSFSPTYYGGDGQIDTGHNILRALRQMVQRTDRRGCYYIEPTWLVNGVPIPPSHHSTTIPSPELFCPPAASPPIPLMFANPVIPQQQQQDNDYERHKHGHGNGHRRSFSRSFEEDLRRLRSSELREIIMNVSLKNQDTEREVVRILKRMHEKRPRPLSAQRPIVGHYLYCRSQNELVEIILELARQDGTGRFKQDVKDLIRVMKENADSRL